MEKRIIMACWIAFWFGMMLSKSDSFKSFIFSLAMWFTFVGISSTIAWFAAEEHFKNQRGKGNE